MYDDCREQLSRLNVHVELASRINKALEEKSLTDLGKLEQDLVFGDATSKEVISYLSSPAASNLPAEDKVSHLSHCFQSLRMRVTGGRSTLQPQFHCHCKSAEMSMHKAVRPCMSMYQLRR